MYQNDESVFKFTSKERDEESFYDYFGARYYGARVGRWGSIDPMLEKHFDFSPYNYVLDNPIFYIDPDGRQIGKLIFDVAKNIFFKPNENEEKGFGNKDEDLDRDGQPDNIDAYDGRSDEQRFRDGIYKKSKELNEVELKSSENNNRIDNDEKTNWKESKEEQLQKQFLEMIKALNIQKELIEAEKNIEIERTKIGITEDK